MIIIVSIVLDEIEGSGNTIIPDGKTSEGFNETLPQMSTTSPNGTSKAFTSQTPNKGSTSPIILGCIIMLNINTDVSFLKFYDLG